MIDENSTFGGFLTAIGEAKQTNANALEIPWRLTHMLLGDANGTDPVPDPEQTQLINQVYRAAINQLFVDPANPGILIAELVLPPNVGGWWIRELGLEDEDGDFVAVANCAPSYKPLLAQGSGRNQVVRMHLIVSNTANVQLKIDPSVVLATRQYVDQQRTQHEQNAEAHTDDQITISQEIPQAPGATDVAGALAALGAFAGDGFQNIAVFDTAGSYTWNVPEVLKSGRRKAWVTLAGAGGAGGAGGSTFAETAGEEGASGGAAIKVIDLTGVESVTVTVGAGGPPQTDAQGGTGGTSSFGAYFSATGGEGGRPGSHRLAAEAGTGIGGDLNITGNHGSATANVGDLAKLPRPGRPGPLGGGGAGGQRVGVGETVSNRNGSFAGASGAGGISANTAGHGAAGIVIVRW